jgi:hypothetical protein
MAGKISIVNNIDIKTFEKNSYQQLKDIYNGLEMDCMVNDAFVLFISYNDFKSSNSPNKLGKQIELYEIAIGAFSKICHVFHKKYVEESVPSLKEEQRSYVEASQIILSRLQNQYNQLVYRQQRSIAYIALAFTVIFSFISIVLSLIPLLCG